jgi:polysaccharide pyruvyl transferase WcaK-like protein
VSVRKYEGELMRNAIPYWSNLPLKMIRTLIRQPHRLLAAVRHRAGLRTSGLSQPPIVVESTAEFKGKYVAHFGLHEVRNIGDIMLFVAVRTLLDNLGGPYRWSLEPLWNEVSTETVTRLNKGASGVIVGGGGLFLRDTNPNQNSGWQWNISIENLKRIEAPIIVFAVGFNKFRNQDDFLPVFREHISELVARSVFFGLRNRGSMRQLQTYLDGNLHGKVKYQPCPTTLLRYLYPQYIDEPNSLNDPETRVIALNIPFDRRHLRFGERQEEILTATARVMRWANQRGYQVSVMEHTPHDANIVPWLLREGVQFHEIALFNKTLREALDAYSKVPLTIGMRGHSQLIPFGVGNAIISLVSHDKLWYFLDDIGHSQWGVDVQSPDLEEQLVAKIEFVQSNYDLIRSQITDAQKVLWDTTVGNVNEITGFIKRWNA